MNLLLVPVDKADNSQDEDNDDDKYH